MKRNCEREREKALERYYVRQATKTSQEKKADALRRRAREAEQERQYRIANKPVHTQLPPKFKVNSHTSLDKALEAAWRRLDIPRDYANPRGLVHERAENVIKAVRKLGWETYKNDLSAVLKLVEHTAAEGEKISEEAWRRNPNSRLWEESQRLVRCLNSLAGMYLECRCWIEDGGVDKLQQLWEKGGLVYQIQ